MPALTCRTHILRRSLLCETLEHMRRMLWSFSRDGAVPGHQLWSRVNGMTATPINAVCFMVVLAFILGLPMLNSTVAFGAVVSISTIGLYISCEQCPFCG